MFGFILFFAQKRKIVGPDRVSGRAFLNRFRVCSRGGDGGNQGGGGGIDEGFFHRFMWKKKESRVLKKMKYLMWS